jgi:hypothetical protein
MNIEIIENTKHNPDYKLVSIDFREQDKFIEVVYGISNKGDNEGLEAYYKKGKNEHHYKSYRWLSNAMPKKWENTFEFLRQFRNEVENGHKIRIEMKHN